jgi:hypothetical protein
MMKKQYFSLTALYRIVGAVVLVFLFSGITFVRGQDPCVPQNLTATDITAHSAVVSWQGTMSPGWVRFHLTGDTNYQYRRAHNNHAMLRWLSSDTEYQWEINLFCNGQWTGYNTGSSFTTLPDTVNCDPVNLTASDITAHTAVVSWEGTMAPGWVRYYKTGDTLYQYRFTHNNHALLRWLAGDTEYQWQINLFCDGAWTGYNAGSSFTTLVDTIGCDPVNLTASNITAHSAMVSWEGTMSPGWVRFFKTGDTIYQYRFARHNHALLRWLADSTEYQWQVNLFCDGCWTGYNAGSSFMTLPDTTTPPCLPTDLMASNITATSAVVSWTGGGSPTWVKYYPEGTNDYHFKRTFRDSTFLGGLQPATTYVWELNTNCGGCPGGHWTGYIVSSSFTTDGGVYANPDGPSAIQDNADKPDIGSLKLYPNPGNEDLNITFESTSAGTCEFIVMDLSGRELLRTEANVSAGLNTDRIDGSSLRQGTYIVIVLKDDAQYQLKWVKTR